MSVSGSGAATGAAWTILVLAGLFEVAWAVSMKYSKGFTRPWPSVATIILLAISMVLLAVAQRSLPLGTAYAVWVGIGAFGAAILGMVLFDEPVTPMRVGCLALLIASIVGLRLTSGAEPA